MDDLKRYEKYKPSGIEWLEDVPEHWELVKLKFCVRLNSTEIESDESDDLFKITLKDIESNTGKLINGSESSSFSGSGNYFQSGDVLFNKLRPYLSKVYKANRKGISVGELLVLTPSENILISDFLFYHLISKQFISVVDNSTYGAKMPRASWNFIGNLKLPIPAVEEQREITNFLSTSVHKIDALIQKKKQLIERLEEKRTALITQTVTKGLNPDVLMKSSGIEWLGDVPEHWEVTKMKFPTNYYNGYAFSSNSYSDNGIPIIRIGDIQKNINWEETVKVDIEQPEKLEKFKIKKGDVLIALSGATVGKTAIFNSGKKAFLNQRVGIIRTCKIHAEYLEYFVLSKIYKEFIKIASFGGAQENIGKDDIGSIPITMPPIKEQRVIAEFLNYKVSEMDELESKIKSGIERLEEYRSSLITHAVTGKVDVRPKTADINHKDLN